MVKEPDGDEREKGEKMKGRWVQISIVLVVFLMVILAGWIWLNRVPSTAKSESPLPSPNGYEDFISAGERAGKIRDPETYTLKEEEELVAKHQESLTLFRSGLQKDVQVPLHRSSGEILKDTFTLLYLGRLLWVKADAEAREERFADSLHSYLDLLHFAMLMDQGGGLLHKRFSMLLVTIALKGLQELLPQVPRNELLPTAQKMEALLSRQYPLQMAVQNESLLQLREITSLPAYSIYFIPRGIAYTRVKELFSDFARLTDFAKVKAEVAEVEEIRKDGVHHYFQWRMARKYKGWLSHLLKLDYHLATFSGETNRWYYTHAQENLVLAKYALEAYLAEYGEYPDTLQRLVPKILKTAPLDPYTQESLKYQKSAMGYLLYSVGPDGEDNQGTPYPEEVLMPHFLGFDRGDIF